MLRRARMPTITENGGLVRSLAARCSGRAVGLGSSMLALSLSLCLGSVAVAAPKKILPSKAIAGEPASSSPASARSTPRVFPLRVIDPAKYSSQKRHARDLARSSLAPSASADRGPAFRSTPTIGPSAVLSGSLNSAGLGATGEVTPPDTTGAIGANHYVEFVNSQVAAYSRTTLALVGSAHNLSTFVKGSGVCDPQIKYDPQTSRWFYVALRCDGTLSQNRLYLGFSKSSDPTDFSTAEGHGWCGYEYNTEKALEDYPKLGLDAQHIIIGTNSFNAETEAFISAHIISLPKPTGTIETCPTAPVLKEFGGSSLKTSVGNPAFTPEPATVADASPTGFVVSADFGEENIMIWRVGGTASVPTLEALGAPKVPHFGVAPPVPQPGSEDELDSLDPRFTQAVAAADPNAGGAEAVWTQHTIAGGARSVVRWYEVVPGKVEVRQVGTISDPTKFIFNGAIAPTLTGGAVINYDTASSSDLVQIVAQSRIGSAPLGTMNTPITLASSSAVDEDFSCPSETAEPAPCRWGDYAGASVDPNDGNTVWGSNQINGPNALGGAQWATQNFALTANDLAPAASFTISPNPATTGSGAVFNGTGSSDPDGSIASYTWGFGDGSPAAGGAAPTHVYSTTGSYEVKLTVTDNGGQTGSVTHTVVVNAPSGGGGGEGGGGTGGGTAPAGVVPTTTSTTSTTTTTATAPVAPTSVFRTPHAVLNAKTGAVTFTTSVSNPGTFSWLATFQNGRFGAFSSASRCKSGFIRLGGRCRPAKIVFAKGSKVVGAAGNVSVTLKPSASALNALKNALRHKKGVPVTIVFSFRSSLGGSSVSHTQSVMVKLKK
jgi:PKD repeat protein